MITQKNHKIHAWHDNQIYIHTFQGESGVKTVKFQLTDDNGNINLADASSVAYQATLPNNTSAFVGCAITDPNQGIVTFTIPTGITQYVGTTIGTITVTTSEGILKFGNICIEVKANDDSNIEATNQFSALDEMLHKIALITPEGTVEVADIVSNNNHKPVTSNAVYSAVTSANKGTMPVTLCSNFVRANARSNDGSLDTSVKYRVTSEDIMKFDYDLNVSVDSGFTAYVVKYVDGIYKSTKSLSNTNGYVIPTNTEFRLHIRKFNENGEEVTETADINEFVNAVKFQTKTALDIAKANKDITEISDNLKATDNALVGELPLKWLQGNVPPLGGGAGNRIIAVLGLMAQPFTISWTDENRVVKVWGYDSDTYNNRTKEISVSSGDTITPAQGVYYAIVTRTEDSAVIKPAYGDNVMVNVAFQKIKELDGRIKTIENKIDNISDDNAIPDYYYADNYLPNKIDEIKKACSILHGVTFAFITDVHFKMNQGQSKKLLKKILNETNVPFVLCGGDIIYLEGTEEELHEQVAEFNNFKSCVGKDRLFCTRGNHDLYNATNPGTDGRVDHYLKTTDVYDTLFRDSERTVSSMSINNGCYCIDNKPQRTRIIMLNTTDVSDDIDYKGGGVSFRSSTLEWLSAALTEKTGYNIIIVCHTPLNYETFTNDVNSGENCDGLSLMVQAFKNKTTFETTRFNTTVQADFTNTTNELICVVSGHRHIDGNSVENNVLNIVTTSDCIDKKDGYGRKAGTISEQAFDVFCINYDTKKIKTVRVGAGNNREFELSENPILNGVDDNGYVLTAADKQEIASLASNTIIVQEPIFVDSVDKMTDTSRLYVLSSTGEIWAYMNTTTTATITENIEGTSDNDFVDDARIGSDGSVATGYSGYVTTPMIDLLKYPVPFTLHLNGGTFLPAASDVYTRIATYTDTKTKISSVQVTNNDVKSVLNVTAAEVSVTADDEASITFNNTPKTNNNNNDGILKYVRFSGKGTSAESNIYVSYEGTISGEQWINTHKTYAPTITTDDKIEIANIVMNEYDSSIMAILGDESDVEE